LDYVIQEYNAVLLRIDKSDEYFSNLSDEAIENVEESKEYKVLLKLIKRASELYLMLNQVN